MLDSTDLEETLAPLASGGHWYLGFSGGVDSAALLDLLCRWREGRAGAPPLTAVHVNHRMQADAGRWQAHCEAVCAARGVPLLTRAVAVDGAEAAAREARYGVFRELLGEGDVLLLAHHLDDQVETFFLRLMRGAGVEGLAAMPATRPLGAGRLVRPLLGVARANIEAYARQRALRWVEDPSNTDTARDRNFLRGQVLPLLATRWPAYRRTVARAGAHLAEAAHALRESSPVPPTVYSVTDDPGLELAPLLGASRAGAARVLRGWLQARGLRAPDQSSLDEFLRQLGRAAADAVPRLATGEWTLQRYRDAVYLLPPPRALPPREAVSIAPGESRRVPGVGRLSLLPARTGLRLGAREVLQVRWRRGGERCRPRGRAGSTPLKKFLQELGVPPWWRDYAPLLCRGEEVLAVADLALCEPAGDASAAAGGVGAAGGEGVAVGGEGYWQLVWER